MEGMGVKIGKNTVVFACSLRKGKKLLLQCYIENADIMDKL